MNDESDYSRRNAAIQFRLAQRAVAVADQIARELAAIRSTPLQVVMVRAKQESAKALAAMIDHDPADVEGMRALQAKVQMFRDMVKFMSEALAEGDSAAQVLDENDKADVADLIVSDQEADDT